MRGCFSSPCSSTSVLSVLTVCLPTMSAASVPLRAAALPSRLLQQYLVLLKRRPVLTKSVTSAVLSALGNLLSQVLEARKKAKAGSPGKEIDAAAASRYAIYGLLFTGPLSHYFYQLMEVWMPSTDPYCLVKRLLLDRLVFAPAFLLLFYFVMNVLEAKRWGDFEQKVRGSYWTALKMNWKVWTPFQFINVNYVPVQFRVLFANMVAFFWYAYLTSVRK